jgi:hypothetical protein
MARRTSLREPAVTRIARWSLMPGFACGGGGGGGGGGGVVVVVVVVV